MLSRPQPVHLITSSRRIPLVLMATSASSSSNPSPRPTTLDNLTFPLELLQSLPPNQQPTTDQIQNFAKSHLHIYLSQLQGQDCCHILINPTRPFLNPFLMPPFNYFSPQVLWFYGVCQFSIIMPLSFLSRLYMDIYMIQLNNILFCGNSFTGLIPYLIGKMNSPNS